SMHSAAHRDFVAEYVKAIRKVGLRVGLYYSPLDWRFPGFFFPDLYLQSAEAMRAQYHRQIKELLSNYGKIDVLWFDGGETDWLSFNHNMTDSRFPERRKDEHYHGRFSWQGAEVNAMIRRLQPQIIVNNRAADVPADFTSREGYGALGNFDNQHPWELCVPIAGAWGYQPNRQPKPLKDYIQLLAKVAGRDGNLLMNVGPDRNGRVDVSQVERLHEIGAWLGKYGKSIYSTRGGPFLPGDWGASTYRAKMIYIHVLNWPGDKLVLPAIPAKIIRASVLTGGEVDFSQSDKSIELSVSPAARDEMDTIVALKLDSSAENIPPLK
ncbi:MAG TPA: alpha-L-fucosidase, partial [Candidatus Binatia bacterium]|nr:alpha-L-fucosidase [Candidatus Binatia bacterium]